MPMHGEIIVYGGEVLQEQIMEYLELIAMNIQIIVVVHHQEHYQAVDIHMEMEQIIHSV